MTRSINIDFTTTRYRARSIRKVLSFETETLLRERTRSKNDVDSQLLRLPRELRGIILHLVVLADAGDQSREEPVSVDSPTISLPPVLHSCHRLRAEAARIFFENTIFIRRRSTVYEEFRTLTNNDRDGLSGLTPQHRALIKTILYVKDASLVPITMAETTIKFHEEALEVSPGSVWVPSLVGGKAVWVNSRREILLHPAHHPGGRGLDVEEVEKEEEEAEGVGSAT